MTTKLTLSIEKETIERAKILSSKAGLSISKIVEQYLNSIIERGEINGPAVSKLSGILKKKAMPGLDWKQVKAGYLKKKHAL